MLQNQMVDLTKERLLITTALFVLNRALNFYACADYSFLRVAGIIHKAVQDEQYSGNEKAFFCQIYHLIL